MVALQHEGEPELARLEEKRLAEEEARHLNATSSASNGVQRTCPIREICDQAVKAPAGTVSTRYPEADPEQTGSVSFGPALVGARFREWPSNLLSITAIVESWSPCLISFSIVSIERISGTFCETLVPPWRKRFHELREQWNNYTYPEVR